MKIEGIEIKEGQLVYVKKDLRLFDRNEQPTINDKMLKIAGRRIRVRDVTSNSVYGGTASSGDWEWISKWLTLKKEDSLIPENEVYKSIYISDKLHEYLLKDKDDSSELYLLGKNKNGVCVKSIKLKATSGCDDMPGISSGTFSKAYIELAKLNLIPFALARTHTSIETIDDSKNWLGDNGNALNLRPGMIYITYGTKLVHAIYEDKYGKLRKAEICIVNEKFKVKEKGGDISGISKKGGRQVRTVDRRVADCSA